MSQADQQDSSLASPLMRAAAFSVHIFTALGAGVALKIDIRTANVRGADRREQHRENERDWDEFLHGMLTDEGARANYRK